MNYEQEQTGANQADASLNRQQNNDQNEPQSATPREWVTVDEAFMLCQNAGLDRTKKTIRSWCRHEHVDGQKQTTPTGERWMVEVNSLQVKIRSELEFLRQVSPIHIDANLFEPVRDEVQATNEPVRTIVQPEGAPVQTSANACEHVHMRTNGSEPSQTSNESDLARIAELERDVRSLEIDKAVRDRQVDFLTDQNKEGQDNLLSQSRYIGHLETQVMQLGGRPNHQFLEAPVARETTDQNLHSDSSQQTPPNPNQPNFNIHTNANQQN